MQQSLVFEVGLVFRFRCMEIAVKFRLVLLAAVAGLEWKQQEFPFPV